MLQQRTSAPAARAARAMAGTFSARAVFDVIASTTNNLQRPAVAPRSASVTRSQISSLKSSDSNSDIGISFQQTTKHSQQ